MKSFRSLTSSFIFVSIFVARTLAQSGTTNASIQKPAPIFVQTTGTTPKGAEEYFERGVQLYNAGDMRAAFSVFIRAAEAGLPKAQLQVGWHYENGAGVIRDDAQAAYWYELSAVGGDERGMKNVGQLCESGMGVQENWLKAARFYRLSAERGCVDGEAALARAYRFGMGVPQDRAQAIKWFQRAAQHGDAQALMEARWLRDPTNNVGFRNEAERAMVIGNRLPFSAALFGADPAGICFRDSTSRAHWLAGLRDRVDQDQAETMRSLARHDAEVRELVSRGYSRQEAESKAGW